MATVVVTSNITSWAACAGAVCLAIMLFRLLSKVRGTTLVAPCLWAILSVVSLALFSAISATSHPTLGLDALRFAAAVTTFCPIMAVLGAKRPQDRGWQWLVFSLWVVVVWPAAQASLLPTGTQIELFIVWKLFLVGLISLGLLNYLPTRFWLPALLVALGQFILFDSYLWRWQFLPSNLTLPLAVACFLAAKIVAKSTIAITTKREAPMNLPGLDEYQQKWLIFRDAYGAFWALRILARVNETAELREWPFRLTWEGFAPPSPDSTDQPTTNQLAELAQIMSTLLRRFNKLSGDQ